MITMTDEEIRDYVRRRIKKQYKSLKGYAIERGVSVESVYHMLNHGHIADSLMSEFGIVRKVIYEVTA